VTSQDVEVFEGPDVDGWEIRPSLWFDALCLIPLLAGLPFYTSRHVQDAALWQKQFSGKAGPKALEGVAILRREIADRAGKPLPAFLALWTSPAAVSMGAAGSCLEQLIATVGEPDLLIDAMRETSNHWSEADEQLFARVRPALVEVLRCLQSAGLAEWWAEHAEPQLQHRCGELRQELISYDLVPLVEHHTRAALPARQVELCVLRWAAPHAIRVTGVRFLGDVRYDTQVLLNNAVHELLHPPWPAHHPVTGLLEALSDDPFLASRFASRDRNAGYGIWRAYAEEDAAQALDQVLLTKIGQATRDPVARWTIADDGMHVLALLLHDAVIRGGFDAGRESYADFLARVLTDGRWWPHDLERRYVQLVESGSAFT
jgi:hypothetical protein